MYRNVKKGMYKIKRECAKNDTKCNVRSVSGMQSDENLYGVLRDLVWWIYPG